MSREALDVNARLDQLERQNRSLKKYGSLALLGLGLLSLASFAAPAVCDVLYGERLVLRDENGRQRLTIDAYRTEVPSIALTDRQGKTMAKLGMDEGGEAFLTLYDAKGATKATYRTDSNAACAPKTKDAGDPTKKNDPAMADE